MLINYRIVNVGCASLLRRCQIIIQPSANASFKANRPLVLFYRQDFAGLGITQFRHLRTRPLSDKSKNGEKAEQDEKDPKDDKADGDEATKKNPESMDDFTKMFEENFKKRIEEISKQKGVKIDIRHVDVKQAARNILMMWFLIGSLVAIGVTYLLVGRRERKTQYDHHFPHAPHVSVDEFFAKYLPTGEVKRVVIFPARNFAFAILYPNAVINGETTRDQAIVVNCNATKLPDQIRRAEERLGIQLKDGVHIELVADIGAVNVLMFLSGMAILVFLGASYFRLARNAINKWRAGDGKNPFSGSGGGSTGWQ